MVRHEPAQASPTGPDLAVAQALTVFEHAVRRHAAAQTELRVARRASTTKAAMKTAEDVIEARLALTAQLQRLGWNPPADVTLTEPSMVVPRRGD